MNILVCVKQVPGSNDIGVDEETGLLIRPKKGNKLNTYDLFALEAALSIKETTDSATCVSVLTMGPPQAQEVLEECLWMGCDEGCLVTDRAFAGSDVLATSYTLSQGIKKIGPQDLILCGKQTTDGDTAQVGAEIAEHLNIPHLSNVTEIVGFAGNCVTVRAIQENLIITEKLRLPCLLCLESDINTPRLPSYKRKKSLSEGHIHFFPLSILMIKTLPITD